jgi:hypothetical protein
VARGLTEAERREARRVFGDSIDYARVRLAESRIGGAWGYARALPWAVYFPPGSFARPDFMPWLVHELTHVWQYRHGASRARMAWNALRRRYDYGGEPALREAARAGKRFRDFNTEQQGEILRHFYERLAAGAPTDAWEPFVAEVRAAPLDRR